MVSAVSKGELVEGVAAGGALFDTRPQPKTVFGLTPRPLSLEAVGGGVLPELSPDTPVYLVCERGQVSELAGLYLEAAGFEHVFHLAGGMRAWPE